MGRPARGDDRGAHHGRRAGPRGLRDPGHVGADGVAVPRQAVDEGGAARGGCAVRRVDGGRQRGRGVRVRRAGRLPADPQAARRRRRLGHDPGRHAGRAGRTRSASSAARASSRSPSRSSSRATRASTTRSPSTGDVAHDFVSHYYPNVLEAMRTRWISPQFIATNRVDTAPAYDELREMGQSGDRRARHRDLGDAHGVVLRAEGPEVLRDRLPPAGRGRLGPLLRGQRHRPLPRVGDGGRARPASARSRRAATPAASSRCAPTATATSPATRASTSCSSSSASGSSTPTCRRRARPPSRSRPGYMANAWVRMRHPDYDTLRGMLDAVGRTLAGPRRVRK